MKRKPIKIIPLLILLLYLPVHLSALPQDLEVFTDFEDISGEGEFFIGEELREEAPLISIVRKEESYVST